MAEYMAYRLSFFLWRVRVNIQLLVTYFLWWAIFSGRTTLFGYSEGMMLTYVLLSSFVRPFVMGTRTQEVGVMINDGTLSNYLTKPLGFFRYIACRDAADKLLNAGCAVVEITLLVFLLRPEVFIQTNPIILVTSFLLLLLGMVLFFHFSLILSLLGFWTPDVWAPRFLTLVITEFFAGMLFPLDILPKPLYLLTTAMPFSYFIYVPLRVYLGAIPWQSVASAFLVGIVWVAVFRLAADTLWRRGLRVYTAEGR
ncbi:ABC-2 family transporter protein [Patescibacteria group bacterium]|nr:ABC-2 family transporter protein [Patescibacteria group bacterium]